VTADPHAGGDPGPSLGRVGLGYDIHPFGAGRRLVLAGVAIDDGTPGLAGHSDADAVAHAVADALLGAAGLGDIGLRYPASDDRYAGADSMGLLADVVAAVQGDGWVVANVDVVVNAERPKLAPHLERMRENLEAVVGAPVNLKPKRGEGIGAVGRGEGIAVWAVSLLAKRTPG
jgi:2-C-methyl-D-erythritol 2,4-cyclodiphosphate synthase